jgi:TonB family protein
MSIKKRLSGLLLCAAVAALPGLTGPRIGSARAVGRSMTASQATIWDRYKLIDGEFSVLFPTVPSMSSYGSNMKSLAKSPLRHLIGVYADGVVYAVYVFDRKQSLDDFMDEFHHPAAMDFKRELSINGVRGKEYGFRNDERLGLQEFLVTSRGIYVFEAQGSLLGNADAGVTKFFDSIRFTQNNDAQTLLDGLGKPWAPPVPVIPETTEEQIFGGRQLERKPVVVTKPEPTYTEEARKQGTTGAVVMRCIFRSSGIVSNIHFVSGLDNGLNERALAAAKQIKFIPAVKDGHFVSMWMELQYNFNLY